MLNSETLEVAIGMAFLFLLMSLICTGIQEWLEGIFKWRAMDLERGVRTLLNDPDGTLTSLVYKHPLVFSLFQGDYEKSHLTSSPTTPGANAKHMRLRARRHLPSYIPAVSFATALIDLVARGKVEKTSDGGAQGQTQRDAPPPLTLALLRERAASEHMPEHLRQVVLSALDHCGGDLERFRLSIQNWFDSSMERASGWYKRRTQAVLFTLGIAMACTLNIDALHVMQRLTADKAFRDVVVKEAAAPPGPGSLAPLEQIKEARNVINSVGMPVGWRKVDAAASPAGWKWVPRQLCVDELKACQTSGDQGELVYGWLRVLAGWLASALAVMLGAPFWFDTLNRLMSLRSTVKPKPRSAEESFAADRLAADRAAAAPEPRPGEAGAAPAQASVPASALQAASDPQAPSVSELVRPRAPARPRIRRTGTPAPGSEPAPVPAPAPAAVE